MARDSEAMKARYLQGAKNDTVAEINGYNNSDEVNGFIMGGKRMWLSLEERQAVKIALDAYEHNGEKTMTKIWDGVEYTFTLDAYRDMLARIEQYASECQNATERHLQAVQKLTTVEEVCDYDYTKGYPEMIDFDASSSDKGGADSAEGGGEQDAKDDTKDTGADSAKTDTKTDGKTDGKTEDKTEDKTDGTDAG